MALIGMVRTCAYLAAAFLFSCCANAATIKLTASGDIALEGRIETGDLEKLRSVLASRPAAGVRKLYLNSEGGQLAEADRIIAAMWRGEGELADTIGPLETVVPAGAHCLSSCAFIFMHGLGAQEETEYPVARSIHVSAKLGFHRPSFTAEEARPGEMSLEDIKKVRTESAEAFNRIISYGAMTTDLIAEFEPKGANEYLAIANVRQAAEWGIGMFVDDPGRAPRMTLNAQNAFTACNRFQDPDYRPDAVTYQTYIKGANLSGVRRLQTFKDRERSVWSGVFLVKVPGGDGADLSCAIWLPHPDDVTRVSTETEGEAADLSWLYLLPPGLAVGDIPGFLLRDQAEALQKKSPEEQASIDPKSTLEPEDRTIVPPADVLNIVPEEKLAEPYAVQVCNASAGFANVRKGPNPRFGVVDRLPNLTQVTVTANAENPDSKAAWKAIRFFKSGRELSGYIDASVLAENCSIAGVAQREPREPAKQPEAIFEARAAVVCNAKAAFANVRMGPSPSYSIAGKIDNGGGITVTGEETNPQSGQIWNRVTFAGGTGYIDSDYVAESCAPDATASIDPVEEEQPPPPIVQVGVVCNPGSVYSNVRQGPAGSFSAVDRANNHQRVEVLSQKQNPSSGHAWYEVRYEANGRQVVGYIDSDYVGAECQLADNVGMDRQVCNASSAFSNVRLGPAASRQLVDSLSNGTKVFVVKGHSSPDSGHLWFEIRYGADGGKAGYIDSDSVKAICQVAGQ